MQSSGQVSDEPPRIVVIGAGAMGSLYGGLLAEAGLPVVLVDVRADQVEAVNTKGLRLTGASGDRLIRVPAATDPAAAGAADFALVFVDSNATSAAARTALQVLRPDGAALTLQNGIGNVEALAAALGPGRVMAGSTYNSAFLAGPGHSHHSNRGETWIGEIEGSATPRLARTAALFRRAGFEMRETNNVLGHVWSKFVLNSAINPVSALTGLRPGEIARTAAAARLLGLLLDEILAVVAAKGIRLPEPDPRAAVLEHCRLRYNRPSMLQHVEAGRPTEIDALLGALLREAAALGLSAPHAEAVLLAVKGLERARHRALFEPPLDEARLEAEAAREMAPG